MKRPMTLTGTILGTVMQALYTVISLIALTFVIDMGSMSEGTMVMSSAIILLVLNLIFAVASVILNAISISSWNKSPEVFKKRKGLLITTIVFNFIFVFFTIITLITGEVSGLNIIIVLTIIAANVLIIVDLGLEGRKTANLNDTIPSKNVANIEEINDSVESKIEKLSYMKEKGMLSEEEFEELKKNYIKQQIKN